MYDLNPTFFIIFTDPDYIFVDVTENDTEESWEVDYNRINTTFSESSYDINPLLIPSESETEGSASSKLNFKSKFSQSSNYGNPEMPSKSIQKNYDLKILKVDLVKLPDMKLPEVKPSNVKPVIKKTRRRVNPPKGYVQKTKFLICPNRCGKIFYFNRTLSKHLETVCGNTPRYACPHCPHRHKHRYMIVRHVKSHHPHFEATVIDLCDGNADVNNSFENNQSNINDTFEEEDTKERLMKQKLLKCIKYLNADSEIKISNVSSLACTEDIKPEVKQLQFVKNPLQRESKLACPNSCGRFFKNSNTLKSHVQYDCLQKPRFKCPYCEIHSKYSRNILHHVRGLHKDRESYAIDIVTKKIFGNIRRRQSERLCNAAKVAQSE